VGIAVSNANPILMMSHNDVIRQVFPTAPMIRFPDWTTIARKSIPESIPTTDDPFEGQTEKDTSGEMIDTIQFPLSPLSCFTYSNVSEVFDVMMLLESRSKVELIGAHRRLRKRCDDGKALLWDDLKTRGVGGGSRRNRS
jgi:hypothetical protein